MVLEFRRVVKPECCRDSKAAARLMPEHVDTRFAGIDKE